MGWLPLVGEVAEEAAEVLFGIDEGNGVGAVISLVNEGVSILSDEMSVDEFSTGDPEF